jgi:hypothetical protein
MISGRIIVGSLKEYLAEQADKIRDQEQEAARKRDEWVAAVDRLIAQMEDWLGQADQGQILQIQERRFPIREEGIGAYEAQGLAIGLGPRQVRVEPVARNVAGPLSATGVIGMSRAYGRVDMTDGLKRYMIFRVEKEPEDRWRIVEQDGFQMQPFDRQSFESAFQGLLE